MINYSSITINNIDIFQIQKDIALDKFSAKLTTNAIGMMFLAYLGVYLLAIWIHELCHAIILKLSTGQIVEIRYLLQKKPKLLCGREEQYDNLTTDQLIILYAAGVISGLIVIAIGNVFVAGIIMLSIPYLYGSRSDIKKIYQLLQ